MLHAMAPRRAVSALLILAPTVAGVVLRRGANASRNLVVVGGGAEPAWDGNQQCIPQTGRRCFNGPSDCEPWVQCTDNFYCVCHNWGCADASGVCRPVHNRWVEKAVRIAPASQPHTYLTMAIDGKSNPSVVKGYPKDDDAEAHWQFLMVPDNETVLITTKMHRYQTDRFHTAYGYYLHLPPPPWTEGSLLTPVQSRPKSVIEATWRLIEKPRGRMSMMHTWSGRYLCFDQALGALSSCSEKYCDDVCGVGSTEFDLWPNTLGLPMVPLGGNPSAGVKKAEPTPPWTGIDVVPKKSPEPVKAEPVYKNTNKTWAEREKNTTKAALKGL